MFQCCLFICLSSFWHISSVWYCRKGKRFGRSKYGTFLYFSVLLNFLCWHSSFSSSLLVKITLSHICLLSNNLIIIHNMSVINFLCRCIWIFILSHWPESVVTRLSWTTLNSGFGCDSIPDGEQFSASVWDQYQTSIIRNLSRQ